MKRSLIPIVTVALLILAAWTENACSNELTGEQLQALSPLFSAYVAGGWCNKEIDTDAAGRYLKGQLGENSRFTLQQVADAGFLIIGFQSMQAQFGLLPSKKKDMNKYCGEMMGSFGPTGTKIPGILKAE
jgi:hypothetical protein